MALTGDVNLPYGGENVRFENVLSKLQNDCVGTATDVTDSCLNCKVVLFGFPEMIKHSWIKRTFNMTNL